MYALSLNNGKCAAIPPACYFQRAGRIVSVANESLSTRVARDRSVPHAAVQSNPLAKIKSPLL